MENKDKIALFMIIRNSKVLPELMGKCSMEYIDNVSYRTMLQCLSDYYLDWNKCEKTFNEAKERYEKGMN